MQLPPPSSQVPSSATRGEFAATATLFLEPFSGLAGDMLLAALLDLSDPRFTLSDLRALADALVPGEARLTTETAWRQNLSGTLLTLVTPESSHPPHRTLKDIAALIERAPLSAAVRARSLAVFRRIAVAEGRVHGCSPDEIHFHEVGAVDTIVDVCGACFALERLGVERVVSTPPVTGTGTVRCAHGLMPVPAPAVAELMRGRECRIEGGGGERLTPTGAALLVEFCERFEAPGAFTAERVGYGAGHRDPKEGPPNVVRVQLGSASPGTASTAVVQLEVNLDDMTGEELALVSERLRAAGALDVPARGTPCARRGAFRFDDDVGRALDELFAHRGRARDRRSRGPLHDAAREGASPARPRFDRACGRVARARRGRFARSAHRPIDARNRDARDPGRSRAVQVRPSRS